MLKQIDVLIIECNPEDQKLVSAYLREYDITYLIAKSGDEARKLISSIYFKLLFLDISLPDIDVCQLTKIIREDMKVNTPIVAMTANSILKTKDQVFEAGMNGCLHKPVGRVELVGMLTQFLPEEKLTSGTYDQFSIIDLSYLREVSLGDEAYELEVAEIFIEMIDQDLLSLQAHFESGDREQLSVVAHRTLSTIYIMGLKSKLDSVLRSIENGGIAKGELKRKLDLVLSVCEAAKSEAMLFIHALKAKNHQA